ncbi:hypothetical protein Tco_0194617 [Tanacetum coccineum]
MLPVTYPDEVEEIIGIPVEVEPLDETPLEDLGLNTCNHDIPLSSREIPRSLSKKTKIKFCSEAGDCVRIYPDGVIFDEKKLGNS